MQYPRETVNELNALSKEVFGTTSKWRKMIEKGVSELVEEEVKRLKIVDGKEVTENTKVPLFHEGPNGGELHQYTLKRYTVDTVKEFMLNVLVMRQKLREAMEKMQKEQKAAQEAKQAVADQASGSSL